MDNLSNLSTVKQVLARHGFSFSKSLGQNFIINPHICPKMVEQSGIDENYLAIEIGTGIGVLTNELAKRAKKVVAIELDQRLFPILAETLAEHDNVEIIHGDILKVDLHEIIATYGKGLKVCVCANLPYYITSPVLMHLLEGEYPVEFITVMVQKEAADRLCATPGTRESSAITVAVHFYSEPKLLFQVSKGSFLPAPKVDSSVIQLRRKEYAAEFTADKKLFFQLVKASFAQRRKTIHNSLASGLHMEKEQVAKAIEASGLAPNLRAEQLTLEDFRKLAEAFANTSK